MMLEEHKKDINKSPKKYRRTWIKRKKPLQRKDKKSLKEIQENMGQQIETNKEEMQKSLKEIEEN